MRRSLDFSRYLPEAHYEHRSLHGHVVGTLGRAILAGEINCGEKLPNENELTEQFGVSRTAVREATKILAAKGLVETRTRTGSTVRPRESWTLLDADVLRWFLETRKDEAFARDLVESREYVEPLAAQLAAERVDRTNLERIEAACALMADNVESAEQFLNADLAFHFAVLGATNNGVLQQYSHALRSAVLIAFERSLVSDDALRNALPLHDAVLEAIRRRDPAAAAEAMTACVRADDADRQVQPRKRRRRR